MYPVVLISAIAIALTSPMANAAEGNAKALQKTALLEYESYIHSLKTSEEPDRFRTPYDPIFSINYGKMYNYRDMQGGKRSHAKSMLEAYWSMGGSFDGFGKCILCHSSDSPALIEKYGEKAVMNNELDIANLAFNPVGCANCHDTKTFALRVTTPPARRYLKAQGKDPDNLPIQEARSAICQQCHFEYDQKTYDGFKHVESDWSVFGNLDKISARYDNPDSAKKVNALSKAPLTVPMNNEAGLASQGDHALRGVACTQCHMPRDSKHNPSFTLHDNVMGSRNVAMSCQSCHPNQSVKQLTDVIEQRMSTWRGERMQGIGKAIASIHLKLHDLLEQGASTNDLAAVYEPLRKAQWRWDYVNWQKGASFHAPKLVSRLMDESDVQIKAANEMLDRIVKEKNYRTPEVPDFSTPEAVAKILGAPWPQPYPEAINYEYVLKSVNNGQESGHLDPAIANDEINAIKAEKSELSSLK